MSPTSEMFFDADLGCARFHGRTNKKGMTAERLSAINAEDDTAAQKRLLNQSKTAGAITLHGSPLPFRLLLSVDGALSSEEVV